jgi:hypothetical protein
VTCLIAASLAISVVGRAETPSPSQVSALGDARYQSILERNAFNLQKPPDPPPPKTNPPVVVPLNLKLQVSGITVGPSGKFAWLVVPQQPGRTNTQF